MCAKIHILPNSGGLFQQRPLHIKKLERVYEAQAMIEDDAAKGVESKQRVKNM